MSKEQRLIYLEDAVSLLEKEIAENQDALKYAYHGDKGTICSEISALRSAITILKHHANRGGVVDAVEVVHGQWVEIPSLMNLPWKKYRCDHCGCPQDYKHNYCPNCGAKMDGDFK